MEEEISFLRSIMKDSKKETYGTFDCYCGKLEEKDAVLLRSGIGKVNAAIGCALMIEHYKPDIVINTGSTGGIAPGLSFGDIVIADGLVYHDVDLTGFGYELGRLPGQPPIFPASEEFIKCAQTAIDELKNEGILKNSLCYLCGQIGSGDTFMCEPDKIDFVRKKFPKVKAVDMESTAIAHTCFLFNTLVLIIRSLSDIAGAESPLAFDEFVPLAAKNSSEIVRRILRNCTIAGKSAD